MNNYIVYEKKECSCVYAKQSGDWYYDNCSNCNDTGWMVTEVSLKDAIVELLIADKGFNACVSSLTWSI